MIDYVNKVFDDIPEESVGSLFDRLDRIQIFERYIAAVEFRVYETKLNEAKKLIGSLSN